MKRQASVEKLNQESLKRQESEKKLQNLEFFEQEANIELKHDIQNLTE